MPKQEDSSPHPTEEKDVCPGFSIRIHIEHVGTINVHPTIVHSGHDDKSARPVTPAEPSASSATARRELLQYVQRLSGHVASAWQPRYEDLWDTLLTLPEVAAEIYRPGKQQNTSFNRNLVAKILSVLIDCGVIAEHNLTRLTTTLEGDKEHSVRQALAQKPSSVIEQKIRHILGK